MKDVLSISGTHIDSVSGQVDTLTFFNVEILGDFTKKIPKSLVTYLPAGIFPVF